MIVVHPPLVAFLQPDVAERLTREGLFGDDPETLATAWRNVCTSWADAIRRARALPAACLDERVPGEWSFLETLRHLIFVIDVWVRDVIEESPSPHHAWGMPPHFVADTASTLGIDVDARPTLDELLAVKRDRDELMTQVVSNLSEEEMLQTCTPRGGKFQVVGAVQTVVYETWAHLQFATRDLNVLQSRTGAP